MQLTQKQLDVLQAEGHLLVTGGPGSGKTTVSILKAAKFAKESAKPGQTILFLSFARASVARVVQAIEQERQVSADQKQRINVDTYHAFFWRILNSHGYLLGLPRNLSILTPPKEAIALSQIRRQFPSAASMTQQEKLERQRLERTELERLARESGQIAFELFAHFAGEILKRSDRIRKLVAIMHPLVILDEFQDTNREQWRVVQALGKRSTLVSLADPEQRIYDWLGADPERIDQFIKEFAPKVFDFGTDNHRSAGTDIAEFGNHLLTGNFKTSPYKGIDIKHYESNSGQAYTKLVTTIYASRKRLVDAGQRDWSVAVLVPTKKLTRVASDNLLSPPAGLPAIAHYATIDMEPAVLSADVIAYLMQTNNAAVDLDELVGLTCGYFRGRGGDNPSQNDLNEANRIVAAYEDWKSRKLASKKPKKNSIIEPLSRAAEAARSTGLRGNPDDDWLKIRRILELGECSRLKQLADDARDVRLLDRGTELRRSLSQDWRENGGYPNALRITRQAFVAEHFAKSSKPETGVVVMNMHKAKGKQFDEVIVFEGWPIISKGKIVANLDRIVRSNSRSEINDQARQNLRVSVTRGKSRSTILTPKSDPCVLLLRA